MRRHIHLFSLLYTYKMSNVHIILFIFTHINIFITYVHAHINTYIYIYIYIYHMYFIFIYIVYIIYLCLDNWNSLDGECSIALSQTVGQSLQRSLIMAQEQKSTRRKEEKAPKNTSCPRAARPVSLPVGIHMDWSLPMESLHPDVTYRDHIPNYPVCSFIKGSSTLAVLNDFTH